MFLKSPTAFRMSHYQCVKSLSVFWVTVSVSKTLTVFWVRIAISVSSHWCQCFKSLSVFWVTVGVSKSPTVFRMSLYQCFKPLSVFHGVTVSVSVQSFCKSLPMFQATSAQCFLSLSILSHPVLSVSSHCRCFESLSQFQILVSKNNPVKLIIVLSVIKKHT